MQSRSVEVHIAEVTRAFDTGRKACAANEAINRIKLVRSRSDIRVISINIGIRSFHLRFNVNHMFTIANASDDRPWYNHWFIEPQLELSYFYVKGEDFKTSTGLEVSQGNADFLTGRAGLVIGKKVNYGTTNDLDKRWYQVGVIGGVTHEFLGDQTIKLTGTEGKSAEVKGHGLGGTSFYYGVTADWQINDSVRIYGEISREEGQHYTKDYGVNLGLKYSF